MRLPFLVMTSDLPQTCAQIEMVNMPDRERRF